MVCPRFCKSKRHSVKRSFQSGNKLFTSAFLHTLRHPASRHKGSSSAEEAELPAYGTVLRSDRHFLPLAFALQKLFIGGQLFLRNLDLCFRGNSLKGIFADGFQFRRLNGDL